MKNHKQWAEGCKTAFATITLLLTLSWAWAQTPLSWVEFPTNAKVGDTAYVRFHWGTSAVPVMNVNQVILTWTYDETQVKIIGSETTKSSSWLVGDSLGMAVANHDDIVHKLEMKLWRMYPESRKSGHGQVASGGPVIILDIDILKRGSSSVEVETPTLAAPCLRVGPNPSDERIWAADECQGKSSLAMAVITNMAGETRFQGWIGEDGLSTRAWPEGLYYVQLQSGGQTAHTKLLILRN